MKPGSDVEGYARRRRLDEGEFRYLAENYDKVEGCIASHRFDKTPMLLTDNPDEEDAISELLDEDVKLDYRSYSIHDEPDAYEIHVVD